MRTVNSITLLGNIARTPERRITAGGKPFATFVVVTHKDSLRGGDRSSVSEFHNVVAWGSLASIAENFCKKGRMVYIEGYLKTRSWNHENGAKIFRTEIVATNVIAITSNEPIDSGVPKGFSPENVPEDSFFDASPDDFFENT